MATASSARATLITLAIIALILVIMVLSPFAGLLFMAAVVATALDAPQRWLAAKLGARPRLAAVILTVATLLVVLIPLATLVLLVAGQVADGIRYIQDTVTKQDVLAFFKNLPEPLRGLGRAFEDLPRTLEGWFPQVQQHGGGALRAVGGVIVSTGTAVIHAALFLVALYLLLVDGRKLVNWVCDALPLRVGQTRELLSEFHRVSIAVLLSTIVTAALQALIALGGYLIAGVPALFFFTFLTFILAFIPAIGAGTVVIAVALLMLAGGQTWQAIFLTFWGLVPVGISDNVVKTVLIKDRMHLHGGVVFFALIGGLALLGPVGLLAGPLVVSLLVVVLRVLKRDYGNPGA